MTAAAAFVIFPETILFASLIIAFIAAGLVFYALRSKGDVRAEFSHGSTKFCLEAKDRSAVKEHPSLTE
jgi:hypothetical protein